MQKYFKNMLPYSNSVHLYIIANVNYYMRKLCIQKLLFKHVQLKLIQHQLFYDKLIYVKQNLHLISMVLIMYITV